MFTKKELATIETIEDYLAEKDVTAFMDKISDNQNIPGGIIRALMAQNKHRFTAYVPELAGGENRTLWTLSTVFDFSGSGYILDHFPDTVSDRITDILIYSGIALINFDCKYFTKSFLVAADAPPSEAFAKYVACDLFLTGAYKHKYPELAKEAK